MKIVKYIIDHRAAGPVASVLLDNGDLLELPGVCGLAASPPYEPEPQHLYLDIINSADGIFEERRPAEGA